MANTLVWRGDAKGVAQVTTVTFTDIEVGDIFNLTINRKTVTITATGTSAASVATQFIAAITAAKRIIPEWAEVTATDGTDLVLTGPADGKPFTVTGTTGDAGNLDVDVEETVEGFAGVDEKQRITIPGTATGGDFTLTFNGDGPTGVIQWDDDGAAIEAIMEADLSTVEAGDIDVTGPSEGPWEVEFLQQYARVDVPLITGDGANIVKGASDYPVIVEVVAQGDPGLNEKQNISLPGPPTGGTFTLTWQGDTTDPIDFDETAANIQTELVANIGAIAAGDIAVTAGGTAQDWNIEFLVTYRNTDVDLFEGDGSSLTGVAAVIVDEITKGKGDNAIQEVSFGNLGTITLQIFLPGGGIDPIGVVDGSTTASFQATFSALIPASDFLVTKVLLPGALRYHVEFIGSLGGQFINPMVASGPQGGVIVIEEGGAGDSANEVQSIRLFEDRQRAISTGTRRRRRSKRPLICSRR
jgi:hypothetical protein